MPNQNVKSKKLSNEQLRFLVWLSKKTTNFEICQEQQMTDIIYNGLYNYIDDKGSRLKFDIRTLIRLLDEELVIGEFTTHFGIKWMRYTVTASGNAFIYSLNNSKI